VENESIEAYNLIVVGGGAAGFFGAIQAAEMNGQLRVLILEKSTKLLSKVKVSGGGRCNVTHNCYDPVKLSHHYPRGEKPLRSIFKRYHVSETVGWFQSKGVKLKAEADGRMFPVTDSSQTIIDCFMNEALRLRIKIEMGEGVTNIDKESSHFKLTSHTGRVYYASHVLIAAGGNPGRQAYGWIEALGHTVVPPIPSLFTFNDSEKKFNDLMGVAVPKAEVRIAGTKLTQEGPLLITHWGLSGPAVIKLSAWAATHLHALNYNFTAMVSWIGTTTEDDIKTQLADHKKTRAKQKVMSNPLFGLPQRLWTRLCELSDIEEQRIWSELPLKNQNRLMEFLIRCPFQIRGKTTFKEEFVTCGGVDLKEVDPDTMQSKKTPGLFFAGEVLNIDGETGGFNFQAAWSTAYTAAKAISSKFQV
jgi:predicted Rossmann fold flavoprotein